MTGTKRGRRAAAVLMALLIATAMIASGCSGMREAFDTGATSSEYEGAPQGGVAPMGEPAYPSESAAPAYEGEQYGDDAVRSAGEADKSSPNYTTPEGDLVIRTKSMLVRVEDVDDAVADIRKLVTKHGGSIEALQLSDDDSPVYWDGSMDGRALLGYATVRVPVAKFQAFVDDAAKLGRVLRHSEDTSDVTQQHVDLKARLGNLRTEEARLREMFDSAKKVSEMLEVERELSRVRGEAEAMQAQIDDLERRAAMSTITIELQGPESIVEPDGTDWGTADALREALRGFVNTVNGIIVLAGYLLPLALIGLVFGLVLRAVVRRRRQKRALAEPAADDAAAEAGTEA